MAYQDKDLFSGSRAWPLMARDAYQKSGCGKEKGAFRVVCRAGTAAHPPRVCTLRNWPDVYSRDGFQMAAGWMRAGLLGPGGRLKAPEEGNREQQRCSMGI